MRLNLIFHRVVNNDSDLRDLYEITFDHFVGIINLIRDISIDKNCYFNSYRFYFDDGDDSFISKCLRNISEKELMNTVLAITTDNIGKENYLKEKDLNDCSKLGVQVASHSVSHPALAFYIEHKACHTSLGGKYQSAPFGHNAILSEQEVLYQMIESKKTLCAMGHMVNEFVLPHGCYNNDILKINKKYSIYDIISTCDNFLDSGYNLRPRILTRNDVSVEKLSHIIKTLKPCAFYE